MAKNMQNTGYRKLDVDAFDPEKYDEAEDNERTIQSMLSTNRYEDALHAALLNPPLKTKNQAIKDKTVNLVAKVVGSFKINEIEGIVQKLTDEEADLLMKYVYKAMEIQPESALCQTLLAWHSQIVARYGLGTIIRVFSDRNRL